MGVYLAILAGLMFRNGGFIGPDTFLLVIVFAVVALGQARTWLRDWIPFVVVLFGWQMLRGYADNVGSGRGFPLHNADLVVAERWLFGGELPTVMLQRALFTPGEVHWYDVMATAFWAFHFVLALAFAFLLWMRSRALYWRYVYALLALSFAGFITYVIFPAVPPWLAHLQYKTIPEPIYLIRAYVLNGLEVGRNASWVIDNGNPNSVAAMPSLHAAYPTLVLMFTLFHWRRLAPLALLYCLGLWFSIVYIGDHYVIDALAGIVYAVITSLAVEGIYRWVAPRRRKRTPESDAVETSG